MHWLRTLWRELLFFCVLVGGVVVLVGMVVGILVREMCEYVVRLLMHLMRLT